METNDIQGSSYSNDLSAYSLPTPAPLNSSSTPFASQEDDLVMSSSTDPSPPHTVSMESTTDGVGKSEDADDSTYESGVGLDFIPVHEDDLSTIGFSVGPTVAQDPDGYKSDDNSYRKRLPREYIPIKTGERDVAFDFKSKRINETNRKEVINRKEVMLPSVEEWSVGESGAEAKKVNQSSLAAMEKIDAIMKRGSKVELKPTMADPSFHEDDVSKVHLIASKYRNSEGDSASTPQTAPGELDDDMRQYIANNNKQQNHTEGSLYTANTGDSHGVYST